jgi:uncharacterized protein (DUF3084 family)
MEPNTQFVAWGILIGSVITSVVGAAATLLTLWFTKGTDSRVRIIKAESEAKALENEEQLVQKDAVIDALEKRVVRLEDEIKTMREQGHAERNRWHEEQIKCAAEAAELRGQLKILSHQFDQLYAQMYPASLQHSPLSGSAPQLGNPLQLGSPVTINPLGPQ